MDSSNSRGQPYRPDGQFFAIDGDDRNLAAMDQLYRNENIGGRPINRGHLMASADGFLKSFQRATMNYYNVMPQFSEFNSGNWEKVERSIRRNLVNQTNDFTVYTGVFGTGLNEVKITTRTDSIGCPVPKLFFKLIVNKNTREKKGIVIIGVNNVSTTAADIEQNYKICRDTSANSPFFQLLGLSDRSNIQKGYIYACRIDDFIMAIQKRDFDLFRMYDLL